MSNRLPTGIHLGVPEAAYHADPCETPSASSSILRELLGRSPEHARQRHPRLNPDFLPRQASAAQQAGTILHAMILGTPAPYKLLRVDDFKMRAAQRLRDEAIDAGLIPLKQAEHDALRLTANAILARLAMMGEVWEAIEAAIEAWHTEATLVWEQAGVLCRGRLDILPPASCGRIYDLKFTGLSADPQRFGSAVARDHAMQAVLYPGGVQALCGGERPLMVLIACETAPPYGITLHALTPQHEALWREKLDVCLAIWRRCLASGEWPSYRAAVHYHEAPGWAERDWDDQQAVLQAMCAMGDA